ncbi:fibronectin type III domain-containing protein [Sphingomonas sp. LR61]|uniref:fibronectin type III domain-containing protein n=1 Tax=Sphingomonas sp. LR61 TaxID=3050234 RepID=UPI002FE420B5
MSYGFINVPGFDDALPQINRSAGAVTVKSEATVRIPLEDYVVTANGQTAKITDRGTVKATHANGQSLVVDSSTLQFTSSKLYYGNASISFEVTDGSAANGGKGRVATLVLPVTVTPRSNQPPAFTGSAVEMQPGETRTVDLTKLTDYPYPKDLPELRYSVVSKPTSGATATISGQQLTIAVPDTAKKNTTASIGIGVQDDANAGRAGTVTVGVVASTRPLVQPGADRSITKRGATTTIDVLTNDQPTNPFPGERLRVVNIRGLSGGLPSGVSVTPSADRSRLQVRVSDTAKPVDAHLQYQVADATNDPDRYVWGDVTVSVQDVPDAPGTPTRTGSYDGGQATLTWSTPQGNNSPITGYRVTGTNGVSKNCGTATVCTLTGLDPKASYRFQVIATNAIGDSKPSGSSAPISADFVPAPPKGITVTPNGSTPNQLDVKWSAVATPNRGSAVDNYVVTIEGPGLSDTRNTGTATNTSFAGAQSGSPYTVKVSARNSADRNGTVVQWNSASASGTAVGVPTAVSVGTPNVDGSSGRTVVSVDYSKSDGQGAPIQSYALVRASGQVSCGPISGGQQVDSTGPGGGTLRDGNAEDGSTTSYVVVASNSFGFCSVSRPTSSVTSYEQPGQANTPSVQVTETAKGVYQLSVTPRGVQKGRADHYLVRYDAGDGWHDLPSGPTAALGYGVGTAVQVQGCRGPGNSYCGPASAAAEPATPVLTEPTVLTKTEGQALSVRAPANGTLTPTYEVRFNGSASDANGAAYTTTSVVPDRALLPGIPTKITITVTVDGRADTWDYDADPAPETSTAPTG